MLKTLRFKFPCFAVILCLLAFPLDGYAHSQKSEDPDVLDSIPTQLRERLFKRLKEVVENNRTRQWDKVFEMLSPSSRAIMQGQHGRRPTKEEWVEQAKHWDADEANFRLFDFTVGRGIFITDTWKDGFYLEGCGQYKKPAKKIKSRFSVSYEDDEWYFSDVQLIFPCVTCEPEECSNN